MSGVKDDVQIDFFGRFGLSFLASHHFILMQIGLKLLLSPLNTNVVVRTACCSVGIVLPVYSTFKAIEMGDQNEQRKWLLYWAVYGSFSIVEAFTDKFLYWFPLYYHVKLAFLVWLQLPSAEISAWEIAIAFTVRKTGFQLITYHWILFPYESLVGSAVEEITKEMYKNNTFGGEDRWREREGA
ncbi:HVA22-like protein k [Capsicum annuum]|nr:HVA22-like protein k [Capsicum annuum]